MADLIVPEQLLNKKYPATGKKTDLKDRECSEINYDKSMEFLFGIMPLVEMIMRVNTFSWGK